MDSLSTEISSKEQTGHQRKQRFLKSDIIIIQTLYNVYAFQYLFLCILQNVFCPLFTGVYGDVTITPNGDREGDFSMLDMTDVEAGTFHVSEKGRQCDVIVAIFTLRARVV